MGIFEQIRNAFSKGGAAPREAAPPAVEEAPAAAARTDRYTVRSGDTLWKIAETVYGDGARYPEIFEANRALLDSPDHILPGQQLTIP